MSIQTQTQTRLWIDEYTEWACKRSPLTPEHFHKNIALTLTAGAIARRVHVQLPHAKIYPNLYTLIIAPTSVYAKTRALEVAKELARRTMSDRILTAISTPEAMISELAGIEPRNFSDLSEAVRTIWKAGAKWGARRLFMIDEAGKFFNSLSRDYNASLDALIMELYDSPDEPIERETQRQGWIRVEKPCLSCLFATTPANIRSLLSGYDSWGSGFWNRWNFVTATEPTVWKNAEHVKIPNQIYSPFQEMSNLLGDRDFSASISPKVVNAHSQFSRNIRDEIIKTEDERTHAILSQLATKRIKAALCFATLENPKRPELRLCHWESTEELAQGWHRDAILAVEMSQRTEKVKKEQKVLMLISSNGGLTARQIQQYTHADSEETMKLLISLKRSGAIKEEPKGKATIWLSNEV